MNVGTSKRRCSVRSGLRLLTASRSARFAGAQFSMNLIKRGLQRLRFLIVDGAPGLEKALAAVRQPIEVVFASLTSGKT
jgi:hypothetical protein